MGDDLVLGDDADNEAGFDVEELRRRAADGDELAQWTLDIGGTEGEPGYPTPEDAALAEWEDYPEVSASIVSVEYRDANNAVVITDTVPSHPMWNYCVRTAQRMGLHPRPQLARTCGELPGDREGGADPCRAPQTPTERYRTSGSLPAAVSSNPDHA